MFSTSDADFCRTLCFTTDCTYFDAYYFIRCWPNWMFCSFIQTVRALFLSPSSNTYRVRCFAHLQQVPDLPRISLYLMLIMSCILPAYRSYVLRFDTLSIRCWLIVRRLVRWLDVCALFLISFCLIDSHTLLARRSYVLCFNAPSSLSGWIEHFASPQIVCASIQCSFHFMLTMYILLNWQLVIPFALDVCGDLTANCCEVIRVCFFLPQIPFLAHGYSNRDGVSSSIVWSAVSLSGPLSSRSSHLTPEGRFYLALASRYLAMLIASAVTCLVLALQWGGNAKAWNDKSVIIVSNISTLSLPQKFDAKLHSVEIFWGSH